MSYIIEQNIKGNIYLYNVDSYWDKEKKQSRQKRTYIGPKNSKKNFSIRAIKSFFVQKNYGNVFLLNWVTKQVGLFDILKNCYPECYRELLALAYYDIVEGTPLYLFPYWLEENHLPDVRKMDSSAISKFCDEVGRNQHTKLNFQECWISHLQPVDALFYDITSISGYSTNIEFIEWGYNRDQENLAQLNMGMVFCNKKSLPIFYTLYPGSIVDVKTLTNCVKFLKSLGLKDCMFVLDRGFFSTDNVTKINNDKLKIKFIQPLPFSLKKVKQLIKTHKKELYDISSNFTFNSELLSHTKSEIQLNDQYYPCHIFLNEKAELDQRQGFLRKIIEIEQKVIKGKVFNSQKEAQAFKKNNIVKAYQEYFKFTRSKSTLERNTKNIKEKISKLGFFILATNKNELGKEEILAKYRNKDQVEKTFNLMKNELDGARLRVHSQSNTDAKLFIKFLALIIQSEIIRVMRTADLFKKYTVRELLAELKKIKYSQINQEVIISEVSKKNRKILCFSQWKKALWGI